MEEKREELLNAADEAAENTAEENAGDAELSEDGENASGSEGEMTLVGWLWRMCIPIIPCAGIVIYIVLLCMWAFGKKQTESMRVWAKAALIATVIKVVLVAVVFLVIELNLHLIPLFVTTFKKILQ